MKQGKHGAHSGVKEIDILNKHATTCSHFSSRSSLACVVARTEFSSPLAILPTTPHQNKPLQQFIHGGTPVNKLAFEDNWLTSSSDKGMKTAKF